MKEREQKEEEKTKALKDLQKLYAVLVADKCASTYVIHCKVHLAKQLREELSRMEHTRKSKTVLSKKSKKGTQCG